MAAISTAAARAVVRLARALVGAAVLGLAPDSVVAHKASDSYLQLRIEPTGGLTARWDIALRDLDTALDLDADGDGKLTWGEVRTAWPRIEAYALPRLRIDGCLLTIVAGQALERRNDGAYAVLQLTSACTLAAAPSIRYTLFREVDPTHRGIAKVQRAGQPLALSVLDPTAADGAGVAPLATTPGATAVAVASAALAASAASPEALPSRGLAMPATVPRAESTATGLGFLREGIRHILTGYDHVLFLLCLLLPAVLQRTPQGWRPVARLRDAVWPVTGIVSAFTVAHSITLGLAAMEWVSLPPSVIEPAIAITIILAAIDNLRPIFPVRRVVVAFVFGLIHGFGFAGVLSELDLPTADFAWALLQFNLGLELGQLAIVVVVTALLFGLRDRPLYRRWVLGGGSLAAIAVGAVWLLERTANLSLLPL